MYKLEYTTDTTLTVSRGDYYKNKTRYYLLPTLYGFGAEFSQHWNKLTKLAVGIQDYNYNTTEDNNLYFLFDVCGPYYYGAYEDPTGSKIKFIESLEFFKTLDEYVTSYSYGSDKQMVVMQVPELFGDIKKKFVEGKYSEMYTEDQLESFIKKSFKSDDLEKLTTPFSVMKKTRAQEIKFKQQLVKDFGATISESDTFTEYEYPPILQEEIFNYRETFS